MPLSKRRARVPVYMYSKCVWLSKYLKVKAMAEQFNLNVQFSPLANKHTKNGIFSDIFKIKHACLQKYFNKHKTNFIISQKNKIISFIIKHQVTVESRHFELH